jgi:hypothetical protein
MTSVLPNTIASGGISPRGWIRELTGLEVLIKDYRLAGAQAYPGLCMRRAKRRGACTYYMRLVYLIDEKQLTKDSWDE